MVVPLDRFTYLPTNRRKVLLLPAPLTPLGIPPSRTYVAPGLRPVTHSHASRYLPRLLSLTHLSTVNTIFNCQSITSMFISTKYLCKSIMRALALHQWHLHHKDLPELRLGDSIHTANKPWLGHWNVAS
jgi:hypothetical protein